MKKVCLTILVLQVVLWSPVVTNGQSTNKITLPDPVITGGKPLMEALADRHTSREFASETLSLQILSDLLWAADGFNRPDKKKRTAPSSMNYQEIDIYLAMANGLFKWDSFSNVLKKVLDKDIRKATGKQSFVETAPLNLVYVADFSRTKSGKSEGQINTSYANTGFIAQNVYLYGASAGLNVVVRGWFDGEKLAEIMKLSPDQQVILCQTVGMPLEK